MWKYILWKVSGLFSLLICKVETQTHLKTRQRVCLMILTGNQRSRPGLSDPPGPRGGPSCLELEGEGRGREVEKWRWGSLSTPLFSDRYIGWWSSARHQAVYWNQGWVFIISLVFMVSIQFQPLNEALGHLTPWCLCLVDEWLLVPNCHTHLYILPKQPRNFHLWIKEAAKIWTWEMFQILNCATLHRSSRLHCQVFVGCLENVCEQSWCLDPLALTASARSTGAPGVTRSKPVWSEPHLGIFHHDFSWWSTRWAGSGWWGRLHTSGRWTSLEWRCPPGRCRLWEKVEEEQRRQWDSGR